MAYSNLSFVRHVGDGNRTLFPLTVAGENMGYFRTEDIHTYVNDVEVSNVINPQSPHLVLITPAPPSGSDVLIRREMPIEKPYADFSRGNNFGHRQVNNTFLQQLYLTQEILDGFLPDGYYMKQDIDMGGNKISNVADAELLDDAATYRQLQANSNKQDAWNRLQDSRISLLEIGQGGSTNANDLLVTARGGTEARKLSEHFSDDLNVLDFGAINSTTLDSTDAFKRAFSVANLFNKRLIATGDFCIKSGEIVAKSSFDFSRAKLHIREGSGDAIAIQSLYNEEEISQEVTVSELKEGTANIPSLDKHRGKCIIIKSRELDINRAPGSRDVNGNLLPPQPQYKAETNAFAKTNTSGREGGGALVYPLLYSYNSVSSIIVRKLDVYAEFYLPEFVCYSTDGINLVSVIRSNTRLIGGKYTEGSRDGDSSPVINAITISKCFNVSTDYASIDSMSSSNKPYSYAVLLTDVAKCRINNITCLSTWSGINGNRYRDLVIKDSEVYSIGVHHSGWDIRVYDSVIQVKANLMGGNLFLLEGCTFPYQYKLVQLRDDYGARWRGDIVIRNCMTDSTSSQLWSSKYRLIDAYITKNTDEWSYDSSEPLGIRGRVIVEGMRFTGDSAGTIMRIGKVNEGASEVVYSPREIIVSDCDFTGGHNPRIQIERWGGTGSGGTTVRYKGCKFNQNYQTVALEYPNAGNKDNNNSYALEFEDCSGLKPYFSAYHKSVVFRDCEIYGVAGSASDQYYPYVVSYYNCRLHDGSYRTKNIGQRYLNCELVGDDVYIMHYPTLISFSGNWMHPKYRWNPVRDTLEKQHFPWVGSYMTKRDFLEPDGSQVRFSVKAQTYVDIAVGMYISTSGGRIYKVTEIDKTVNNTSRTVPLWSKGGSREFGRIYKHKGEMYSSIGTGTFDETPDVINSKYSGVTDGRLMPVGKIRHVVYLASEDAEAFNNLVTDEDAVINGVTYSFIEDLNDYIK